MAHYCSPSFLILIMFIFSYRCALNLLHSVAWDRFDWRPCCFIVSFSMTMAMPFIQFVANRWLNFWPHLEASGKKLFFISLVTTILPPSCLQCISESPFTPLFRLPFYTLAGCWILLDRWAIDWPQQPGWECASPIAKAIVCMTGIWCLMYSPLRFIGSLVQKNPIASHCCH